jgi:HAE1 family hydrophobic/amphiphilic exporter-1
VSQLLTLYITPVVYLYLDKVDRLLKHRIDPSGGLQEERKPRMMRAVAAE